MLVEDKITVLRNSLFLRDLPSEALYELASRSMVTEYPADHTVVEKGTRGTTMYFIVEGGARVHDGELHLATLGEGHAFGEISALDAGERSASVTTTTDSRMLVVDQKDLHESISASPGAAFSLIRAICQRERNIVADLAGRAEKVLSYERELEIGRKIQSSFLPERLPTPEGWGIAASFNAAREVAGDYYDGFDLGGSGYTGVLVGDVCDKGVGAALFMTLFRSLVRASCLFGTDLDATASTVERSPVQMLTGSVRMTNRYIATTHRKSSMFASMFFGIFDNSSGHIWYINAGHEPVLVFNPDGTVRQLDRTGPVIGLFPEAAFGVEEALIEPGELLLAYSDGLTEAMDAASEQFTLDRVVETCRGLETDARGTLDAIKRALEAFVGDAPQHDDITVLAVKRG